MRLDNKKQRVRLWALVFVLFWTGFGGLCANLRPIPDSEHSWTTQPLQPATKQFFCDRLGLANDHPVCQPDRDVYAVDLLPPLEEHFPVNQTPYSEIAEVLKGYPAEAEETRSPEGIVTSKRYAYLLTEFDGFCVYFSVRDVKSGIVTRIYSSSIGSGPTSDVCTSPKVREQPRPWSK